MNYDNNIMVTPLSYAKVYGKGPEYSMHYRGYVEGVRVRVVHLVEDLPDSFTDVRISELMQGAVSVHVDDPDNTLYGFI
jgi:hypothetical protein